MISYHFVPISSQKGVLFLRHPVVFLYFAITLSRFSLLTCSACFDRCEGIVSRSENSIDFQWKVPGAFHS